MIRKWSYISTINNNTLNNSYPYPKTPYKHFKFKIFRKNTRYKKYNLSVTSFVRKYPISRKRRFNWKFHITLSSEWVKHLFNSRQLFITVQSRFMFSSLAYSPYIINFVHNLKSLMGLGVYSLSFTRVNPYLYKNINSFNKNQNNLTSSSSLNNLLKLNNLGFLFSYISYFNEKYPLNNTLTQSLSPSKVSKINLISYNPLTLIVQALIALYKVLKTTTLLLLV